jgi:GxxExxY protein
LPRVFAGTRGLFRVTDGANRRPMQLRHGALTRRIILTFFDVYNELGPGFLESVYRVALAHALRADGVRTDAEVPIDVFFRHAVIGRFYADLVAENRVIIEVKAVRCLAREHHAQLLHYLRATAMEIGLLLNFGPRPQFQRVIYSNARKHGMAPP